MAKVITVAQQKGGAGKTTLVVQIATALARLDHKIAIVDTDPQGSLTGWMRIREHEQRDASGIQFSMIGGWRLDAELKRLKREHDIIIVDTPPHAETEAKVAIRAADLALIPLQPSPADLWATRPTVALAVKDANDACLVLNRVPPRGRSVDDARDEIERQGWPTLATHLGNRQGFITSFGRGLGIVEAEPRSPSAAEVTSLTDEILSRIR